MTDHDHVRASFNGACCQQTRVVGAPCPVGWDCPHDAYTFFTYAWMTMHQFQEMELVESGIRIDLLRYDDTVIDDVPANTVDVPHAFRGWRFHS